MSDIVPTDKQQLFLSSDSDILLFGGTVAGGKSFALLLDALGLNDPDFGPRITLPYYRALIYRQQYKHLLELIDKSKQLYPKIDKFAVYNNSGMFWRFKSGAIVSFCYFENRLAAEQIRGRELAWIGCDELGLYETPEVMEFCLSRLRSAEGLKCYYRATSNVSKFKWVRQYFKINDLGESTKKVLISTLSDGTKVKKVIEYIQSKMSDNPHIPKEYEANLQLLSESDRLAFINGYWNAYDSDPNAIYKKNLDKMFEDGRFTDVKIQPDFDYYAAFDLGRSDSTPIILYQFIGKEIHIFDCYENNNEDITHYISWLKDNGYGNAKIILPHDAKQHRLEFNDSIYDNFYKNFDSVKVLECLKIEEGIDNAKRKFENVWIDKTKCERVVECLTNYKRKYNAHLNVYLEPMHDWSSHMADAFRYMCLSEPSAKIKLDMLDIMDQYSY